MVSGSVPVVGLWVRAPGSSDFREMKENVYVNRDNIKPLPEDRPYLSTLRRQHPGLKAALVDGIDLFDDAYFGIGESEAIYMDPQQRLLMQGVVHALEDAGITMAVVCRSHPAVFTAAWCYDYKDLLPADQYLASGNSASVMCGRISYFFNTRGASVGVETACSSSLVALHLARQSILCGESQLAIVCGANHVGARSFNSLYQSHMVSPDGRLAAFDRNANGFVRAESFTVAILCSESFAKEHGLRERCRVIGSAYNNDGKTASLTAPNPLAQHEVQMTTMEGLDASTVDVVTCHGTGTKLGDQVELTAINKSFKPSVRVVGPKSSLGHGEGASGLVGLFQSILLMEAGQLPSQLHVSIPIELLEDKSLALVCEEVEVNRMAISSYGFGGTNACAVIDRVEPRRELVDNEKEMLKVLLLSAKSDQVLDEHIAQYADFLEQSYESLSDILHTTNYRRTPYDVRAAVVGGNREELSRNLRNGKVMKEVNMGNFCLTVGSRPAERLSTFRRFEAASEVFKQSLDKYSAVASSCGISDVRGAIFFPFSSSLSPLTERVAELVVCVAYCDMLESHAALPDVVQGRGVSYMVSLASAGFISLQDAIKLIKCLIAEGDVAAAVSTIQLSSPRCAVNKGKAASKRINGEDICKVVKQEDLQAEHLMEFAIDGQQVAPWQEDPVRQLELLLASLYVAGNDVIVSHESGTIVDVPAYPFSKRRFWPENNEDALGVGIEENIAVTEEDQVDSFDMVSVTTRLREVVKKFVDNLESDDDDILEGGELDSLSTIEMLEAISSAMGLQMPFDILESASSVSAIAEFIAPQLQANSSKPKKATKKKQSVGSASDKIGIVSADFRFPGGANSPEEFLDTLLTGRHVTKQMDDTRKYQIGTRNDYQVGLLSDDISMFDHGFFAISKDEALFMDPQHRILLHCAYNAWEKAGFPDLADSNLYVAVSANSEYRQLVENYVDELDDRLWMGTNHSMVAGRLAQLMGVRGRAIVVDTTCSSVASAVELCLSAMRNEGRDWGVVAATQLVQSARWMDSLKALLPEDFTKSFSIEASGFVRSDAVGVLVLKRLQPTDLPLVILGSAETAHSGAVVTPVVATISGMLSQCGQVDYVEGHGTATAVGDGVEAMSYSGHWDEIIMASTKAQFGHSEVASGLVQICKVATIMSSSAIPAISHNLLPNDHIRSNGSLRLPFVNEEKEVESAAIVSFGITGTKTAIVGRKAERLTEKDQDQLTYILPVSAKTKEGLKKSITHMMDLISNTSEDMRHIARMMQKQKSHHKWRVAVVGSSHTTVVDKLRHSILDPQPAYSSWLLPSGPCAIHIDSFILAVDEFHENYISCCDRLRFKPFSDPTSQYHRFAASFALLKFILKSRNPLYMAATGANALVVLAALEVTRAHYINDITQSYFSQDVRQMKRISRDIAISLPIKIYNGNGELIESARQAVDASAIEEFNESASFPDGTIFLGNSKKDTATLSTYSDYLEAVSAMYIEGADIDWTQFGHPTKTLTLPEYPFERRAIWIPMGQRKYTVMDSQTPGLSVDLNTVEWSHIKNHVINGEVIVPGATSMRIIGRISGHRAVSIASIDFLAPILPKSHMIKFLEKNEDGAKTLTADEVDAVAYTTFPIIVERSVQPFESPKKVLSSTEIYQRFAISALTYRDNFQMISTMYCSFGKGVVHFKPIDRVDILIDGSLQAMAMGYLMEVSTDHNPYLPFNIDRIDIHTTDIQTSVLVGYFTYTNNGPFINGDISVYQGDELVLNIKQACFKRKDIGGGGSVTETTETKSKTIPRSSETLRKKAKEYIMKWFDEAYGWSDVDENAGFFDLGLSSLQAVKLRNYLKEQYPNATATSVFDYPTIANLADYLASLEDDAISKTNAKKEEEEDNEQDEVPLSRVAVSPVGVLAAACRLPGGICCPEEFWDLLKTGRFPNCRAPASRIPTRDVLIKGQKYGNPVEGGNFITQDVSQFDPAFFKISKSEAEMIDPQQRILLECVQECIENAGITDMSDVGVFVGLMEKEYTDLMESNTTILSMLGSMVAVIAGRINYVFGSYGPSVTVDTACSSSLVAVEMAINAILDGRCSKAIVAGVNLILNEKGQGLRTNGKMLSLHGMSLSFDARASGYGRSDGCVVIILEKCKPSSRYMGSVCGVNVNHGGRSVSLTAPNGIAHRMLLTSLLQTAATRDVQYWEAHGTGTPLGDPIEVNTLSSVFDELIVGSVKASLGHGEASAGTCGLLKLFLMMRGDYVPPLIHFHVINKDIQSGHLTFPIVGHDLSLTAGGISSFGVSGTNAAAIACKEMSTSSSQDALHKYYVLPLSAKNQKSLLRFEEEVTAMLSLSSWSIDDICGTLSARNMHDYRSALLVTRNGKVLQRVEGKPMKGTRKPRHCVLVTGDAIDWNLLAVDAISEYYQSLEGYTFSNEDRLAFAVLKFLRGASSDIEIYPTSVKYLGLCLLADGVVELSHRTVDLFNSLKKETFEESLRDEGIPADNRIVANAKVIFAGNALPEDIKIFNLASTGELSDHRSLLEILCTIHTDLRDIDWSMLYDSPTGYIPLPNYKFNRQTIWFKEVEPVYEHNILGTIAESSVDGQTTFQNLLSQLRHPQLFRGPIDLGTAIEVADAAFRHMLHSSFTLEKLQMHHVKMSKSSWLVTKVTITGEKASLSATIDGVPLFACSATKIHAKQTASEAQAPFLDDSIFVKEIPSAIIASSADGMFIRVDSSFESSAYQAAFATLANVLDQAIAISDVSLTCIAPLNKEFSITRADRNGRLEFDIHSDAHIVMRLSLLSQGPRKYSFNTAPVITRKKTVVQESQLQRVVRAVRSALDDINVSGEKLDDSQLSVNYKDLGLESVSIVDFCNRLTQKYFPGIDITTTDVIDHPSVMQLSEWIVERLENPAAASSTRKNTIQNPAVTAFGPTQSDVEGQNEDVANENSKETAEKISLPSFGVTSKIISALNDIMTDGVDEEAIAKDEGFMEMGMDSLSMVDFVNRLGQKYFPDMDISTTDVFDNPTIASLAIHLQSKLVPSLVAPLTRKEAVPLTMQQLSVFKDDVKSETEPSKENINETANSIMRALSDISTDEVVFNEETMNTGFIELGLDSLAVVDFVNRLNEKYFPGLDISTTEIFDYGTVNELAEFIRKKNNTDGTEDVTHKRTVNEIVNHNKTEIDVSTQLDDVFVLVEEQQNNDCEFILENNHSTIQLRRASDGMLTLVPQTKDPQFSKKLSDLLIGNPRILINISEGSVSVEDLFLTLINLCSTVAANKQKSILEVSSHPSLLNTISRSVCKTIAAEKYPCVQFKWSERLQQCSIDREIVKEKIGGNWLITGGLAGIGLTIAKWLVKEGVHGLVLTSRRQPSGDLLKVLEEMRKTTDVHVISADVAVLEEMERAFRYIRLKLDGVIHNAGVLQDARIERQSRNSFLKVFGPKAIGYEVLDQLLDKYHHKPSSFIVMSSFTSVCGNVGQANYGAANAYLDYQMLTRRNNGKAGTTIQWGNWLDTGMAANEQVHKILRDIGFIGMSNEEALQYLKFAIICKPPQMLAAKLNWKIILSNRPDIRKDLVMDTVHRFSGITEKHVNDTKPQSEIEFEACSDEEGDLMEKITSELKAIVCRSLNIPANRLKTGKSFMELGFTSYTLSLFLKEVSEKYKEDITLALVYEYPSIDDLAEYLSLLEHKQEEPTEENQNHEEMTSWLDIFGANIFYDDKSSFSSNKTLILRSLKETIEFRHVRSGKYCQHVSGGSLQEVIDKLNNMEFVENVTPNAGRSVIMFSGQGAQYPLMGIQLCEVFPVFRDTYYYCLTVADSHLRGSKSLLEIVHNSENYEELLKTTHMQPIMFSFCYASAKLWHSLGFRPDFYLGHSVGELVAAVLAGMISLAEGLRLIVARGVAMEKIAGRGALLAIDRRAADDVLRQFKVFIATINSPKQIVIAGTKGELDKALSWVKSKEMQATYVNTKYPFHSGLITDEDLADLKSVLEEIKFRQATTPIVSNVTGKLMDTLSEDYIIKHTISAVRFVDCVDTLVAEGVNTWVEAGPGATLSSFLKRIIDPVILKKHCVLQTAKDKDKDADCVMSTMFELEKRGHPMDWLALYGEPSIQSIAPINFPICRDLAVTSEEKIVLHDHKLRNELVVAGCYQMYNVLKEANADSTSTEFYTLTNVKFPSPWNLAETSTFKISRQHSNQMEVIANRSITCTSTMKLHKTLVSPLLNQEKLTKTCLTDCNMKDFYLNMARNGLEYGPLFQVMDTLKRDEKRTISSGVLMNDFVWPLMDGSLHSVCLVLHHRKPTSFFVPVAIGEVYADSFYEAKKGQTATFMTEIASENDKFIQFNSCLLLDGRLVFQGRNVTCIVIDAASTQEQQANPETNKTNGALSSNRFLSDNSSNNQNCVNGSLNGTNLIKTEGASTTIKKTKQEEIVMIQ